MYCHSAKGCEPAFIITETKGGKEKEVRSLLIKVLNCFTNMQNLYKKCIVVQLKKKKKKAFKHTITKLLKSWPGIYTIIQQSLQNDKNVQWFQTYSLTHSHQS